MAPAGDRREPLAQRLRRMPTEDVAAHLVYLESEADGYLGLLQDPGLDDETQQLIPELVARVDAGKRDCTDELHRRRMRDELPGRVARTTLTREFIDAVKARVNLVALVQAHGVELKERGRLFVGRCPLDHQDSDPSFTVYPEGHFFCFGCKKGGDAIRFVEQRDQVGFREALRRVAEFAGVEMPERIGAPSLPGPADAPGASPRATETEPAPGAALTEPAAVAPATWADMERSIGPITWDWQGWLPRGHLIIIASESGAGKSTVNLRIADCYVRGNPWPDGAGFGGETGRALWCEAEAGQAINLQRAKQWGLPLDALLTPLHDPLEDVRLEDPAHREAILRLATDARVRLIVVDSLRGAHRGDENDSSVVEVVLWLAGLARDTGKPVLLTHHLRKRGVLDGGEAIGLDRLRGSSAIVQPARVVWAIDTQDAAHPSHKRLAVIKSNLARFPDPLGFTIDENGIAFGRAPAPPHKETLEDRAVDLLLNLLAKGPKLAGELQQEIEASGLSWSTAKRAKNRLEIVSVRSGVNWLWSLPSREHE